MVGSPASVCLAVCSNSDRREAITRSPSWKSLALAVRDALRGGALYLPETGSGHNAADFYANVLHAMSAAPKRKQYVFQQIVGPVCMPENSCFYVKSWRAGFAAAFFDPGTEAAEVRGISAPRRQGEIGRLETVGKIPEYAIPQDGRTAPYYTHSQPPG